MPNSNHAGFKIPVILLFLCLSMLSLPERCTARLETLGFMSMVTSQQPMLEEISPPFNLPVKLDEASVLQFPSAIAMRTYIYTQEERIIIYYYADRTSATRDMEAYASAGTRITADQSALLAEHYGCVREVNSTLMEWFVLDNCIVGIQVPAGSKTSAVLISVAEKMIRSSEIRLEKLFSTPDKCFSTYLSAMEEQETALVLECFSSDGSAAMKKNLKVLRNLMPMLGLAEIMDNWSSGGCKKPEIKFKQAELLSEDTARLRVSLEDSSCLDEPTAIGLLTFMARANKYIDSDIWVPFRKNGGKWGIDLAVLQARGLVDSQKSATRGDCQSNLKQIGLALFMYIQDNKERLPADLSALIPYTKNTDVFKCPSDDGCAEITEIKPGFKSSYFLVRGLSNLMKDPSRVVVVYEASPLFHGDGRNVLFMDGHVKWYNEESFQNLMKKQGELKTPAKKTPVKKSSVSTLKKKKRK
ncbi:MAG: hypothetical protein PHD91_04165 [bacterium]|jgi:prepilin-type processing-associated H-X9-DG protein|nr:hypothetical protein [bacterium]MDD4558691.1 hypothetical protein [bacterium]